MPQKPVAKMIKAIDWPFIVPDDESCSGKTRFSGRKKSIKLRRTRKILMSSNSPVNVF
jgi:hypothetical protein